MIYFQTRILKIKNLSGLYFIVNVEHYTPTSLFALGSKNLSDSFSREPILNYKSELVSKK